MYIFDQLNLFNDIKSRTINTIGIEESAKRLGVSTATIRNWIKTKYLKSSEKGRIAIESLEQFQSEILGKEKLTQRANKSLKDLHNHDKITNKFLDIIALHSVSLDKIGFDYESSLSDSYRNKEGIYYTPDEVVRNLFTIPTSDIQNFSFCDPCCGSGNFVVRAIELGFRPDCIYGFDTDPVAVEITKARIYRMTGYKSNNIKVDNFLTMATAKETPKFNYIYTNPPWGKKLPKEERWLYGQRLGAGASLDTCSLFFFACLECISNYGKIGLLLPESFFNIAAFEDARLKALHLFIERIVDYGKVFNGLMIKAQAIVLRNTPAIPAQEVVCEHLNFCSKRSVESFACNPKAIMNFYCKDEDAKVLKNLMSIPFITLKNRASWGIGIVTGNNKKFVKNKYQHGYIPVFKGSDILKGELKEASSFIPSDFSLYQQVASINLFKSKEKLIYKFISNRLCFFHDTKQRFVLNSINMLIPDNDFPVSVKVLGDLLNSDFMNWIFSCIFNTHKILRGDLESLPIHSQFLSDGAGFDEQNYIEQLNIEKIDNGTYRVKR